MSSNISIHFNAASMLEASDDEDILSGFPKDALHFEVHKPHKPPEVSVPVIPTTTSEMCEMNGTSRNKVDSTSENKTNGSGKISLLISLCDSPMYGFLYQELNTAQN